MDKRNAKITLDVPIDIPGESEVIWMGVKNNKIFNVSGGRKSAFSLKELSEWCCGNIFFKKINSNKKNRKFDLKWIVLDNSKAKKSFRTSSKMA